MNASFIYFIANDSCHHMFVIIDMVVILLFFYMNEIYIATYKIIITYEW